MYLLGIIDSGIDSPPITVGEMVVTFGYVSEPDFAIVEPKIREMVVTVGFVSEPDFAIVEPKIREMIATIGFALTEIYSGSEIIEGNEYYVMESGLDLAYYGGVTPSTIGETFVATESGILP